jgi:hypothetical protein
MVILSNEIKKINKTSHIEKTTNPEGDCQRTGSWKINVSKNLKVCDIYSRLLPLISADSPALAASVLRERTL